MIVLLSPVADAEVTGASTWRARRAARLNLPLRRGASRSARGESGAASPSGLRPRQRALHCVPRVGAWVGLVLAAQPARAANTDM